MESDVVQLTIVNGPSIVGTMKMCVYRVELFDDPCGRGYYLDLTKEFKNIYSIFHGCIMPDNFIYDIHYPMSNVRIAPDSIYAMVFEAIINKNIDYESLGPYCTFEITVIGI